jgi:competence ComEA-like helix-hairpin-helix protein
MTLYTRQQLIVLLALVAAAGVGIAVDRWRHAYPELVERVERFDRAPDAVEGEPGASAPAPSARAPGRDPAARPPAKLGGAADAPIDLNTASPDQLMRLPGVGRALAARIVEARTVGGRFDSVDELRRVRGLGGAKLERLRPFVVTAER